MLFANNENHINCESYVCLTCQYKNVLPYIPNPIICPSRNGSVTCVSPIIMNTLIRNNVGPLPIIRRNSI